MLADKLLKFSSIIFKKLLYINYILLFFLSLIFIIGFLLLYSAAGGSMEPWASKQLIRFIICIGIFMLIFTNGFDFEEFFRPRYYFRSLLSF